MSYAEGPGRAMSHVVPHEGPSGRVDGLGRTQLRALIAAVRLGPVPDPRVDAVAHVICRMGGHVPHVDNEGPGSCDYHKRHAVVALELADATTTRRADPLRGAAEAVVSSLSDSTRRRVLRAEGRDDYRTPPAKVAAWALRDLIRALDRGGR